MRKRIVLFLTLMLLASGLMARDVSANQWGTNPDRGILKEVQAPSGNPLSNTIWIYAKDVSGVAHLFVEYDDGTVVDLGTTATVTLDEAYTNGRTITLDATGDMVIRTDPDTNPNELVFDVVTGVGALADMIIVQTTSGTITDFIDCTDAGVTNCLNIGGNSILGAGGIINFNEFDVSGTTGAITINDGGDLGAITIEGTVLDINTLRFVGAGNVVSAAGTAITLDADSGNLAAEDLIVTANNFSVTAAGNVTVGNDLAVTGAITAASFKQDTIQPATAAPADLTVQGNGAGKVKIAPNAASTGNIELGGTGGATTIDVLAGADLQVSEGKLTVTNTANENVVTVTANSVVGNKVIAVTGNGITTGDMLYLETSDAGLTSGNYIRAYNGAANVFTVADEGATVITGVVDTDVLTLTNGDIKVTLGDIRLSNGILTADWDTDQASHFIRNFAGAGTNPVVTVRDDNTASTNVAMLVDQDGTGASTALKVVHDGDNPAIDLSAGVARTGDVIAVAMANQLGQRAINITGAMTSTAGGGVIEVHGTGVIPATASLLRLDADTAQPGDGDGWMLNIDDDSLVVATPDKYAVLIDSANNEALHVATGKALFDEMPTFTLGVDINSDVDIDLAANSNEVDITAAATDYAANSGVVQIYGSGAGGQTNASYLLRLARKANADAQDHFIQAVDNSTGAAGNGAVVFSLDSGGAMTVAGTITPQGAITGDGGGALGGMLITVTNDTNGKTVAIAESQNINTNSGAGAPGVWDLPECSTAIGAVFTFVVMAAQNMDINPDTGDQIQILTNAAGDAVRASTVGSSITLTCMDATNIAVLSIYPVANWTDVN